MISPFKLLYFSLVSFGNIYFHQRSKELVGILHKCCFWDKMCASSKTTRGKEMEENSKAFLEPIMWLLRIQKIFGGLPLDITFTEEKTLMKFSWWQGVKMMVFIFVIIITLIAPQFYELLCSLIPGQVKIFYHDFKAI
jgi:hypothetical protein